MNAEAGDSWPTVTIVFLVHNRRAELRESLRRMVVDSDYDPARVDTIVVDNASNDGSAAMVREEFPHVQVIARELNVGVSAWNDGFAAARGEYVLALDDDCYLSPDGLSRAVAAAREHDADLVSFKVVSTRDPEHVFSDDYRTGLFMFWGCAVLFRRRVLEELRGYDPEIFVWANELEFTVRFFDRGFRHLHFPEVAANHMASIDLPTGQAIPMRSYRANARHWAYIAAKLFRRRDAAEALVALLANNVRAAIRVDRVALRAVPETLRGFVHGLRHRRPVRSAELSRFYRRNFVSFASPLRLARPPRELLAALPREIARGKLVSGNRPGVGRVERFYADRARFYPDQAEVLQFSHSDASDVPERR